MNAYYLKSKEGDIYPFIGVSSLEEAQECIDDYELIETEDNVYIDDNGTAFFESNAPDDAVLAFYDINTLDWVAAE